MATSDTKRSRVEYLWIASPGPGGTVVSSPGQFLVAACAGDTLVKRTRPKFRIGVDSLTVETVAQMRAPMFA